MPSTVCCSMRCARVTPRAPNCTCWVTFAGHDESCRRHTTCSNSGIRGQPLSRESLGCRVPICHAAVMAATTLDGKATATRVKEDLAVRVAELRAAGIQPGLGTVLVGDDPGSH